MAQYHYFYVKNVISFIKKKIDFFFVWNVHLTYTIIKNINMEKNNCSRTDAAKLEIINKDLIFASKNGFIDIVRALVKKGANIHVNNNQPLRFRNTKRTY